MTVETFTPDCPLCGNRQSTFFDQRRFRGHIVTNRICDRCGLVYQAPRMLDASLSQFYEREYRLIVQEAEGPIAKDLLTQRRRAEHLLEFILENQSSVSHHLDIGCSAGLFLEVIQGHFQCAAVGVEPGESYRMYAQQRGLQVFESLDALEAVYVQNSARKPFDLVSLAHVLEHLPDPVGYLRTIRDKYLQPGGAVLIEVPNLYGHECFEISHLVSFSPHMLRQTLHQAGFEVQRMKTHGFPRSRLIPLYLTALARPAARQEAEAVLQPEQQVLRKRQGAMFYRRVVTRLFPWWAWLPVKD